MNSYHGVNRRISERTYLPTSCHTSFVHAGTLYSALMVDLSEQGARFSLNETTKRCDLAKDETLTCEINTPYGISLCSGRVAWTSETGDVYEWGMEFTGLSPDEKDPIRCLMDSAF